MQILLHHRLKGLGAALESLKSLFERMAAKYGPVYKLNKVTRYNVLIISDNTCGAIAFISDI